MLSVPDNTKTYGITYLSKDETISFSEESYKPTPPKETNVKGKPTEASQYVFNERTVGVPKSPPIGVQGVGAKGVIGAKQPSRAKEVGGSRVAAGATDAPSNIKERKPTKQGNRTVDAGVGHKAGEEFKQREGYGDKWVGSRRTGTTSELAVGRKETKQRRETNVRVIQSKLHQAEHDEATSKLRGTGGKQPPKPEKERESDSFEEREDHRDHNKPEKKQTHRPKSKRPSVGYYSPKTNEITNIKAKAQLTIIKAQLLKIKNLK